MDNDDQDPSARRDQFILRVALVAAAIGLAMLAFGVYESWFVAR